MGPTKKILLLGSGFVAGPCIDYLLRREENVVSVACRTISKAEKLCRDIDTNKTGRAQPMVLDIANEQQLDKAVSEHDIVISLIPYIHHTIVIRSAIKSKKDVVTTSYISPAMQELDQAVKDAGITVMNEIGLDPGIDHLYALKVINEVHDQGGKITSFRSFCGGLPAPEASNNPLGYKFSWSARGVLLALRNDAKYWEDGKIVNISGPQLMDSARDLYTYPAFAIVGYGNRDSSIYKERYNIPEAHTIIRGTMRYKGFPEFAKTLVNIGFLNDEPHSFLSSSNNKSLTWNQVTAKILGSSDTNPEILSQLIESHIDATDPNVCQNIKRGIKWLGILSSEIQVSKAGTYLDVLCARLEELMQYEEGERDMILLQHTFEIEKSDGLNETRTSTLLKYGTPNGYQAMATTVGVPCGIATQLILDGKLTQKGVIAPMTPDIYEPIMELIEQEKLGCVEAVL